ncbi:DWNN domain-domain-containing protein [Yarrowia lipolytica]|uniref:YALI0A09834p n=2 Tax=Yarrowia lipolytica TaxID=4952 RepID=Q6CHE1_YARLI|nr:YALI0A09834p [Yarrowia lipolytica CLIB122]AOW00459.1 hypothetical protein YALI1_A09626g [Yarrowia lipolytica]KAB8282932.1 DWNN domain-containing protein [Yarrowia lipolytica]KAE8170955.1 DWNN domain-containing protein [Yarrowia lipolytica]KAJ8051529.1 DWNN domain-containing protein [Yarrowia lipolytica]QNP95545.1 Protein MPE1 [Yarrowia lipolytica]|eukprot:XP_499921.1 YALI0A09834p [Yarrowia lipolytica CLIB122]
MSFVYYKFKSQKEPSKVVFDGTSISVFDLKREIITSNKLDKSADQFDLAIVNPDTKDEYRDDNELIARSSSVLARRLPSRPGKGEAARYVNGAPPVTRYRRDDQEVVQPTSATPGSTGTGGAEDDLINAMFAAQGEQWKETQKQMAYQTPVYNRPSSSGKPLSANSNNPQAAAAQAQYGDTPPEGYMCHKCGKKDHFIWNCPTNNDPNWEGMRMRRTTGIPKSFLKTIAKPNLNEDDLDGKSAVLINEDGEYVVQVADQKSWEKQKARARHAVEDTKAKRKADIDPELVCPLSKKLFDHPVTTPCCKTTYSEDAIQQALLDGDFVCPKCGAEEILLDQLHPDKEMEKRVKEHIKKEQKKEEPDAKRTKTEDGSAVSQAGSSAPPNAPTGPAGMPQMPFIPPQMMPFFMKQMEQMRKMGMPVPPMPNMPMGGASGGQTFVANPNGVTNGQFMDKGARRQQMNQKRRYDDRR